MSTSITLYNSAREYLIDGTIAIETDTWKLALIANTYTFSAAHTILADVSSHEVSNGDGYTTGGASLASLTLGRSGGTVTIDANNVTYTALTKTFRGGLLYVNVTRNTIVNPIVAYIVFDDTPADIVNAGTDYTVTWNASGIITLS
jgi:hypothetical protein